MKPFIELDGVLYINEAVLAKDAFSKGVYSGGDNVDTDISLRLVGNNFKLEVKEGRFSITDRNGVERITGKFYD